MLHDSAMLYKFTIDIDIDIVYFPVLFSFISISRVIGSEHHL